MVRVFRERTPGGKAARLMRNVGFRIAIGHQVQGDSVFQPGAAPGEPESGGDSGIDERVEHVVARPPDEHLCLNGRIDHPGPQRLPSEMGATRFSRRVRVVNVNAT